MTFYDAETALDALKLTEAVTGTSIDGVEGSKLVQDMDKREDSESPEASLNRKDIAMGVTPIAARESVVKYQVRRNQQMSDT
jgi:hypothetical protein